jgi:putative ABC transport system permease protein
MTVRAAIGAGRGRLVRQLLVESLVLSTLGSAAGLWMASVLGEMLAHVLRIDSAMGPHLDARVLAFALLLAVVAAAVFSLAPAVHLSNRDLMSRLRQTSLQTSEGLQQRRTHGALVVAQIALATVLLSASGLLMVSLSHLRNVDLGFQPQHVLTFPVRLATARYRQSQRAPFFDELTARLRALPGVRAVGAGGQLPLQGSISRTVIDEVDGAPVRHIGISFASITPQYFRSLGIPIERGREFTEGDTAAAPSVVILNQAAVRQYFPSGDPLGRQIVPEMWNGSGSRTQPRTVVGVCADIKLQGLDAKATPAIYWPIAQVPSDVSMFVNVQTAGDPLPLAGGVREQLRGMDKDMPLYDVHPLGYYVDRQLAQPRSTTVLIAMLALLALILTAVGLYGVIAYSVARQTREIGIRMALGATRRQILRRFVAGGLWLSLAGVAIGLPASAAAASLLRTLLFGIGSQKPLIFAGGAAFLIVVALLASYLPARRATRIDPMAALRYE